MLKANNGKSRLKFNNNEHSLQITTKTYVQLQKTYTQNLRYWMLAIAKKNAIHTYFTNTQP